MEKKDFLSLEDVVAIILVLSYEAIYIKVGKKYMLYIIVLVFEQGKLLLVFTKHHNDNSLFVPFVRHRHVDMSKFVQVWMLFNKYK